MKLSRRLETIASFVPKGSIVADIGTDHGYIPIWLVREGVCPRAYAMDVRKGPLERAAAHVKGYGLSEKITLRLSDGLRELSAGEADTVVIAGMGGRLTCRILEEGRRLWDVTSHFILSPQSELSVVRRFLEAEGFAIVREAMVKEDGKYYTVMEAVRGERRLLKDCFYEYGEHLIRQRSEVLLEYLKREQTAAEELLSALSRTESKGAERRREELFGRLKTIREALDEMEKSKKERKTG